MKRIVLVGSAVAGLFTVGVTTAASAATPHTKKVTKYVRVMETQAKRTTKMVPVDTSCKLALTAVAPAGATAVSPGSEQGTTFGSTACGAPLNSGTSKQMFSLDTSGDLTGTIQHWFKTGTVYGTFTLSPSAPTGPPTTTSFGAAAYSGTVTFKGAGGGLSGTTGTATLTCQTNDSVHFTCTEKLKLTQKVTTVTLVKVPVRKKVTVG